MKELKLKYSKIIPFNGFYAMSLFGYLFRRDFYKDTPVSKTTYNHEGLHICQAEDFCKGFFGYIIFYIWYILEWIIKIPFCVLLGKRAYFSISFEQEAYNFEDDFEYQDKRKRFAWMKYIFKLI